MPGISRAHWITAGVGAALTLALMPFSADAARVAAGLALLVLGADWLVENAAGLAKLLGVSSFVIGLSVVAFGTSAPELGVAVQATLKGEGELAVGNIVGSNIANICLILGLTAIFRPVPCQANIIREDVPVMIGITVMSMFFLASGIGVSRTEGTMLTTGIVLYILWLVVRARKESAGIPDPIAAQIEEILGPDDGEPKSAKRILFQILFLVLGGVMLWQGSDQLVAGAGGIARELGVSETVIGLTIVAFGTSVPELVTSMTAAFKRESDIAVGNILGSNIFNLLSVMGIAALVAPLPVDNETITRDMWIMLAVALACFPLMGYQGKISRVEGFVLVTIYVLYILWAFGVVKVW